MSPPTVQRACPVCASREAAPHWQKETLRVVRCAACGMLYASPVPESFTSGTYYDQVGNDFYLSPAKLAGDYAPSRFDRELRLFRRHCRRGRVLDVGCSSGAFLFQLRERFPGDYRVLGTDVSGPALEHAASRGIPVRRGDFLAGDFPDPAYEAITFWAVLEHLDQPHGFLARAASLLAPGGLCFVLVPNLGSLATRLLGARYRYVYPQHLNYFSRTTLGRLANEWFEPVETRTAHFNPMVIWQDWRGRGREVSNQERAALLQRTNRYKASRWLGPVKAAYRGAEGLLAAIGWADNLAMVLRRREA